MTKYIFQKDETTFGYKFFNVNSPIVVPKDEEIQFYYTVGVLEDKKWLDMILWGVRDYTSRGIKVESRISRTGLTDISFCLAFRVRVLDNSITELGYIELLDPTGEVSHTISFTLEDDNE